MVTQSVVATADKTTTKRNPSEWREAEASEREGMARAYCCLSYRGGRPVTVETRHIPGASFVQRRELQRNAAPYSSSMKVRMEAVCGTLIEIMFHECYE
jgi:hypothetical protein